MTDFQSSLASLARLQTSGPSNSQEFGKHLILAGKALSAFLLETRKHYGDIRTPNDLLYFFHLTCRMLNRIAWKHTIKTQAVPWGQVDRKAPMLSGPIYSSKEYPWPEINGAPAEPIFQIDLEVAGGLAGLPLGSGMLQLWVHPHSDKYILRNIPLIALRGSDPTPPSLNLSSCSFGSTPFGDWDGYASMITEYGEKQISYPAGLSDCLEDLASYLSTEHAAVILGFLPFVTGDEVDKSHFLFGTSNPIQYSAAERPPTLIALDSKYPFCWGDNGNAQVFYSIRPDANVKFSFDWSCG